ncbi:replication initiation protein, partial [Klebsiella pneumoniae]|nr:replication initiation protein [Klebsiella pneumoniae]
GKMKPLRYAAAVENALRKKLEADTRYSGLICKNPNHGHWKIAVWQPELYTLDWLSDFLDLNAASDKDIVADYGLGRNCTLFDKTRKWAYRAIRQGWPEYEQWLQACYERASAYNLQLAVPLDENELMGIAKSIAKWTFSKFSESSFHDFVIRTHRSDIQSKRGKLSKGGGRPSLGEPWVTIGVSRATYFRNRKGLKC